MLPDLDETMRGCLDWETTQQTLPSGPIKLVKDADGKTTVLAVGSEGGSKRSQRIATVRRAED